MEEQFNAQIAIGIVEYEKKGVVSIKTVFERDRTIGIITEALGMLVRDCPKNEHSKRIGIIKKHIKSVIKDNSYQML